MATKTHKIAQEGQDYGLTPILKIAQEGQDYGLTPILLAGGGVAA